MTFPESLFSFLQATNGFTDLASRYNYAWTLETIVIENRRSWSDEETPLDRHCWLSAEMGLEAGSASLSTPPARVRSFTGIGLTAKRDGLQLGLRASGQGGSTALYPFDPFRVHWRTLTHAAGISPGAPSDYSPCSGQRAVKRGVIHA